MKLLPISLALVACAGSRIASAQSDQPPTRAQADVVTPAPPSQRTVQWFVAGNVRHWFTADLEDDLGDVSVTRADATIGVSIPLDDNGLDIRFGTEQSDYDFGGSVDPFGRTQTYDLSALLFVTEGERWGWFVGGGLTSGFESGADVGNSFTGRAFGGIRYAFSETFSMNLGAGFSTRLERDPSFIPAVGVDWRITEQWRLGSEGLGLRLFYTPVEEFTASVGARYDSREYRLDEDGPNPDGVAFDRRVPVDLRLDWRPITSLTVSLFGGVDAWQRYRIGDSSDVKIRDIETDPQPFLGAGLEFRF